MYVILTCNTSNNHHHSIPYVNSPVVGSANIEPSDQTSPFPYSSIIYENILYYKQEREWHQHRKDMEKVTLISSLYLNVERKMLLNIGCCAAPSLLHPFPSSYVYALCLLGVLYCCFNRIMKESLFFFFSTYYTIFQLLIL